MKEKIFLTAFFILMVIFTRAQVQVWQKWTRVFKSEKVYSNPYTDLTIEVEFTGPKNVKYTVNGYWSGKQDYAVNFSFPETGNWMWKVVCSDKENKGLHLQTGTVNVKKYNGTNPLFKNGFLKISENNRYLAFDNGTPFLWMGCTAWNGTVSASIDEWKEYINDRARKKFTVIQISPFNKWKKEGVLKRGINDTLVGAEKNVLGDEPFLEYFSKIHPAYWVDLAQKIQYANENGLVVALVGLPGWQFYFDDKQEQKIFVQYLTGLLAGNFVIYSPSSDRPYSEESNFLAMVIDSIDDRHLITQHPGTPSGKPVNIFSEEYYDKPYLDFSMCQTGHNGGRRDRCVWNAIYWNLSLYNREPHKPVINAEAFYHGGNRNALDQKYRGTDTDARSLGWYSWLSGATGYTYGVLGIWNWGHASGGILVPWREAMKMNSSFHMQYLSEFLSKINWWELEPYRKAIINQPQDTIKLSAFAKNTDGTMAVAYIPANSSIEVDMTVFKSPVRAKWFNPRENQYSGISGILKNESTYKFVPPSGTDEDWVLLMKTK